MTGVFDPARLRQRMIIRIITPTTPMVPKEMEMDEWL